MYPNSPPTARASLSILLAEDNPINQDLFRQMLERLGHQVQAVGDGIAVLEALQQQSYDIVLLDLKMPRLDGLETATRICQMPEPRPVLIALTANSHLEDQDRCLQAGMDDFLSKPIRMVDLGRMIDRYAERCLHRSTPPAGEASTFKGSAQSVPSPIPPAHPTQAPTAQAPTVQAPTAQAPIDFQNLRQLKQELEEEDDFLSEMLQSYWRTSTKLIQQIQYAAQEADQVALEFALHGLKSISASIGAYPLVGLAEAVEQCSHAGTIEAESIQRSIQDLVQFHQTTCQAIQQELNRLSLAQLGQRS